MLSILPLEGGGNDADESEGGLFVLVSFSPEVEETGSKLANVFLRESTGKSSGCGVEAETGGGKGDIGEGGIASRGGGSVMLAAGENSGLSDAIFTAAEKLLIEGESA